MFLKSSTAGIYCYFNQQRQTCLAFDYLGCEGNKNRFDSESDCYNICGTQKPNKSADESPIAILPPNEAVISKKDCDEVCWHMCVDRFIYVPPIVFLNMKRL